MAPPFRLTPLAVSDLEHIWNYIAADSEEAADRVESAILKACTRLARNPRLGLKREDIQAPRVRFWTVPRFPNYIVVYLPETKPLQVVAVLHGKRNLKRALQGREDQ